jgi:hypothetical protein
MADCQGSCEFTSSCSSYENCLDEPLNMTRFNVGEFGNEHCAFETAWAAAR